MASATLDIDILRRYSIARTLFKPTTLASAIQRLGFVQADPLRAPARAQDLTLRHRVTAYQAGDLEAHYPTLPIEEDFFVNYGFMTRDLHHLMHPRTLTTEWSAQQKKQAQAILAFVRDIGVAHPAQVDAEFDHGRVINWFGGNSKASTQLLQQLHFRGLLRVVRREGGQRLYAIRTHQACELTPEAIQDRLVDVIVAKYAPLPAASLTQLIGLLMGGVPQWRQCRGAIAQRARTRLPATDVQGTTWLWPAGENPLSTRYQDDDQRDDRVRLLAPFDPLVWDRRRFAQLWGWEYRFEAYTPAAKRVRGHYALPLLWRDQVLGWANLRVTDGVLTPQIGFVATPLKSKIFARELDAELDRFSIFLKLNTAS